MYAVILRMGPLYVNILLYFVFCFSCCDATGNGIDNMSSFFNRADSWSRRLADISNIPELELQALQDIYSATNGPNWKCCQPNGTVAWDFSTIDPDPCTDRWQGIQCTVRNSSYYVSEINLPDSNIEGTLPTSIGVFSVLDGLYFNNNGLNGTIPNSLGNISQLNNIYLYSNYLNGSIPSSFGNISFLNNLYLYENSLTGTIPASMGNLILLKDLVISTNSLTGTIPSALGAFVELYYMDLSYNCLTGTIPNAIGNLQSMSYLFLMGNNITGSLPNSFGNLTNLSELDASLNAIRGTIPSSFGRLSKLIYLYLFENYLTGMMPTALTNLTALQYLELDSNILNGTIPSGFENVEKLEVLNLNSNYLSGSLPSALGNLNELTVLYLQYNCLTGSVPPSIGNLSFMVLLDLSANKLNCTIPSSLGNMARLAELYLSSNCLTGTIPSDIGKLNVLFNLELSDNDVTGVLPSALGNMDALEELEIENTAVTGTIPTAYGKLEQLKTLYLSNNCLSGSVPMVFGNHSFLRVLVLNDNSLSGSLPTGLPFIVYLDLAFNQLEGSLPLFLSNCTSLLQLQLNNNYFSGSLGGAFNATAQLTLFDIQLNNNQLTGSIPMEMFLLKSLSTLVASVNCFHGTLPSTVCLAVNMKSLVLDGLSSATSCRDVIFPSISPAYIITDTVDGVILPCVYELPSISALSLSGNGFTGSIPNYVNFSKLDNMDLSHNFLNGAIGVNVQNNNWSTLDLSYNRISGTLDSDYPIQSSGAALYLEDNRISGDIPDNLINMDNISILSSNIFSCDLSGNGLPKHDNGKRNYVCGSTDFDIYIYLWFGIFGIVCICSVLHCWNRFNCCSCLIPTLKLMDWLSYTDVNAECVALANLGHCFTYFLQLSTYCTVFIIVVLVPTYVLLADHYGTYTHEYAYKVSAAFISGTVPFGLEYACWTLFLCGSLILLYYFYSTYSHSSSKPDVDLVPKLSLTTYDKVWISSIYVVVNFVVVVGFNAGYVYLVIYESSSYLLLEQVVLSVCKIIWNTGCTTPLLDKIEQYVASRRTDDYSFRSRLQFTVSLFNNILIPLFIVMVISPDCFYNFFVAAPAVTSTYDTVLCQKRDYDVCVELGLEEQKSTYNPPIVYSYECSASFITYYAPTFVSFCIFNSFVVPLMKVMAVTLHQELPCNTTLHTLLTTIIPRMLKPLPNDSNEQPDVLYFKVVHVLVLLGTNIGLLMTFGAVFPPLGVCFLISTFAVVFVTRLEIGRFISAAMTEDKLIYKTKVEMECAKVEFFSVIEFITWMVVSVSCLFYTVFLFDAYGDAVGYHRAYWVWFAMPLLPLLLYGTSVWFHALFNSTKKIDEVGENRDTLVEMSPSTTFNPVLQ